MHRRRLLLNLAAIAACPTAAATAPLANGTSARLCMAEDLRFFQGPAEHVQRRFDYYRQLGFGTLRANVGWRHLEVAQGDWSGQPALQRHLDLAVRNGFRLKIAVETIGAPPAWFLDAHPDALLRNAHQEESRNDLSLWYPKLRETIEEKTTRLFGRIRDFGLFPYIDWVFADLGPASEPIYPAIWTQGKSGCHTATPWFYGAHAQEAFGQAMRAKYGSVKHANASWGTYFRDWPEMALPVLGTQNAPLWHDVLIWYRDSKRDFITWQVGNYRRAIERFAPAAARPQLIIMVPGRHIKPQQWQSAEQSGLPDCALTVMADTEFLLDLGQSRKCALQYTADENGDEVAYLRSYMLQHGNTQILWGENVGVPGVADHPDHIADVILANHLYGMDYVRASDIFEADGMTPNAVFAELAEACGRLRRAWG